MMKTIKSLVLKNLLLVLCVSFSLTACIQIGKYQVPVSSPSSYKAPSQTGFSDDDLNDYRKTGSYYKKLNANHNDHLPRGKSYTVKGKTYTPYTSAVGFEEIGIASWYGPGFHGNKTSNGERFNTYAMTAAHKLLPFDTHILVTNLENGKSCVVRINDRGPFVDERIIDLSQAAAEKIGMIKNGTAKVHLQYVGGKNVTADNNGASGILGTLFGIGNSSEERSVYTDSDQSVSAALASLAGGSMAGDGAGYSSNSSMYQVNRTYVNTARTPQYGQQSQYGKNQFGQQAQYGQVQNAAMQGATSLYLHLAVYQDKGIANRLVQELQKRNVPARIFQDNGFHSVHAGPFKDKATAQKAQQYLKKNFPNAYMLAR